MALIIPPGRPWTLVPPHKGILTLGRKDQKFCPGKNSDLGARSPESTSQRSLQPERCDLGQATPLSLSFLFDKMGVAFGPTSQSGAEV